MDKPSSKNRSGTSKTQFSTRQQPPQPSPARPPKSKKSKVVSSAAQTSATDPVRLHITPLTAESAKAIVPAKHLATASFHAIDTFPERSYGFVTVPRADAETLRRKYNGTVFRGVKMSVEEARPSKMATPSSDSEESAKSKREKSPRSDKSKREDGVLPGFEIPEGRQVKRGWTKDINQKGGKSKIKALNTTSECLFKTILPPVIASELKKTEFGEEKPSKKKAKGKTVKDQVVVHEFKHSTKFPSFLKMNSLPTDSTGKSAEFVDGTGWVNEAGEVIEGAPAKRRRLSVDEETSSNEAQESPSSEEGDKINNEQEMMDAPTHESASSEASVSDSSSATSESESGSENESVDSETNASESAAEENGSDTESSNEASSGVSESSSSDSDSSSDSESEPNTEKEPAEPTSSKSTPLSEPIPKKVSSNFANLTNIFKPKLLLKTESTSQFKFFEGDLSNEDDETEEENQDEEAASKQTKLKAKTGAGSGMASWAGTKKTFDNDDGDEEEEEEEVVKDAAPEKSNKVKRKRAESEDEDETEGSLSVDQVWEKVFFENRGDWNRQWKRKKREVLKTKRKKEKAKRVTEFQKLPSSHSINSSATPAPSTTTALSNPQIRFLATRWAAKEAAYKASINLIATTPEQWMGWKNFEITHGLHGEPLLMIRDGKGGKMGNGMVSVSHDGDYVIAMAMVPAKF
ncbi:hypothetical protein ABW20_dc0106468 [Dactylellina cionopaga]|nr:hypothetical protein ABW20_dc0106468 [Dactylellina cionopaga]